jgi:hypothetical protein
MRPCYDSLCECSREHIRGFLSDLGRTPEITSTVQFQDGPTFASEPSHNARASMGGRESRRR